ncbi:MAG: hypothetical protein K2N51_15680, partial [Lachnospiraceae bacterium]|nr:hypothetical protein [Lachnospiraceae bacterium]
ITTDYFSGDQIYEILQLINYVEKYYGKTKIPLYVSLGKTTFADKLVYIILENICWYMIFKKRQDFRIYFIPEYTIWSEGISFSPLGYTNTPQIFKTKYLKDLSGRHYRKIITKTTEENSIYLSNLMQEIRCFLENNMVEQNTCNELSEVLVELVGNAGEHTGTECLIDIDITETWHGRDDSTAKYYGMNAVILNYSPILFFEPLKKKLEGNINLSDRYNLILQAKKLHFNQPHKKYDQNDFYTVSSFQHKISGSEKKQKLGGTGLTSLIKSLEEKSDSNLCYMLSGHRILFFFHEYLKYDNNNFIGFNEQGDFLSYIPDESIFSSIITNIPGTAYNLNFAIKKEE